MLCTYQCLERAAGEGEARQHDRVPGHGERQDLHRHDADQGGAGRAGRGPQGGLPRQQRAPGGPAGSRHPQGHRAQVR